jgi:2-methylcitrate dehydratase PrpD
MPADKHPVEHLSAKLQLTRFEDFPAATIEKAKLHILDTIGVALAGAASAETRTILQGLGLDADSGRSAAWGLGYRLNPRSASFINGVSAHALELDDSGGCDHSGAVVLPAALAMLPEIHHAVSGKALLRSVLLGYETGRRVLEATGGYEQHNGRGWHSTGTCGVFGAATSAALLLDLDQQQLSSALGIACSYAGGTWGFIHDGSQTKKLHSGRAAEGGVCAALLASKGFQGPKAVFDPGVWGSFFSSFTPELTDVHALYAEFGRNWRLNRCSIKPYATCRGTHSAIDAVQSLLSTHQIQAGDIVRIRVAMSPFQFGMCGGKSVTTRAEAQMSLPYALAARLHFGRVGLAQLETAAFSAPEISQWLSRIDVVSDPSMADDAEPMVTLQCATQHFSKTINSPLGSPDNPLPPQQLLEKFMDLATGTLPPAALETLRHRVLTLDTQQDVRDLPNLLCSG